MPNKIENIHKLEKHDWQKPHQPNLTGTDSAYYPNKNNKDATEKKYKSWKYTKFIFIYISIYCIYDI